MPEFTVIHVLTLTAIFIAVVIAFGQLETTNSNETMHEIARNRNSIELQRLEFERWKYNENFALRRSVEVQKKVTARTSGHKIASTIKEAKERSDEIDDVKTSRRSPQSSSINREEASTLKPVAQSSTRILKDKSHLRGLRREEKAQRASQETLSPSPGAGA